MKLAFSTLGCPEWDMERIIDAVRRYGYDGVEFRGLLDQIDLVNVPEFMPAEIADTRIRLQAAGVLVSCLSSSVQVVASTGDEVDRHAAVAHAKRYVEMAEAVEAPFVRLFCGNVPDGMEHSVALSRAVESLREIGDFAQPRGVTAVVETHDAFVRSELLRELIHDTRHSAVGVLWDIHHPYRLAGESIPHTVNYLGEYIRYTHVKDSLQDETGDDYTYTLLGNGDVPILPALRALRQLDYDGFLTLEWEKRWIPTLAEPEVAFTQYSSKMRSLLAQLD